MDPTPLILDRVQALGELHTARHAYNQVFTYETQRTPAEWAKWIPGAASVVGATTANRALVSITGTVEAGVDLGQVQVRRSATGVVVRIPMPTVYEPHIHAKIHSYRRGLLWQDANLPLKAVDSAKRTVSEASVRAGILATAQTEARRRVETLIRESHQVPVTVEFGT